MNNSLVCMREPLNLALSLDEVKQYLRITNSDDDEVILSVMKAVIALCESYTGLSMIKQEWQAVFVNVIERKIRLPKQPVKKINFVEMINSYGKSYIMAKNHYDFNQQTSDLIFRLSLPTDKVRVEFIVGFGIDPEDIPHQLKLAMFDHVAFLLENRGVEKQFNMQKYDFFRNFKL